MCRVFSLSLYVSPRYSSVSLRFVVRVVVLNSSCLLIIHNSFDQYKYIATCFVSILSWKRASGSKL